MKLSELIYNAQIAMDRYGDIDVRYEPKKGLEIITEATVISLTDGESYLPYFVVRGDY